MKIPRDAARPRLEELLALSDEMQTLPFQPDEEEVLRGIIDNAQTFRQRIERYCSPLLSTEAEAETQRFYLRKLEGAEVLLSFETNFFRQELHKWCPVAPEPPPILEVSLSTRKPRPTKLQKMLLEYGVDNPDDLPEHAKGKANSLRRKAANAEAAAAAAATSGASPGQVRPSSSSAFSDPLKFWPRPAQSAKAGNGNIPHGHPDRPPSSSDGTLGKPDPMDIDSNLHPSFLDSGGPQLHVGNDAVSLEERLLQGRDDEINLHTEAGRSKALEILGRTETGRRQAIKIWGPDVWGHTQGSLSENGRSMTPIDLDMMKTDDGNVDQMFKEMTNQDDDEDQRKKDTLTAESLESERNGLDALLDGE